MNEKSMNEMILPERYDYYFTIFIPAYNRAHVLDTTFQSIGSLTFRDFEVLAVDDGSTDETHELVETWIEKAAFPIRYIHQPNSGKVGAHNTALQHAKGFLFFTVDAGDSVFPETLTEIRKHWEDIPEKDRSHFAGVCGLCIQDDGNISGAPFARDVIDSNFNEIYSVSAMKMEKRLAIRLSVLTEFPYPRIEGETHQRPTIIYRRMAHRYKIRFLNVPLQIYRKETDGISRNSFSIYMKNPKGQSLFFLEEITLNARYHSWKKLYRLHVKYIRFSLHAKVGFLIQAGEITHPFLWTLALHRGIWIWAKDKVRLWMKTY